jgi:hypothetical protein
LSSRLSFGNVRFGSFSTVYVMSAQCLLSTR